MKNKNKTYGIMPPAKPVGFSYVPPCPTKWDNALAWLTIAAFITVLGLVGGCQ